ncbi:MAG: response regulator [Chloroflexi bacterium]|nr:response regulator [Chloroflexota bacterium]
MKRILVVDDEKTVAFFLSETLAESSLEYQVQTASSAEDALSKIVIESFSLVITDLRMPGMSGLELIDQIRQISPSTRTILITAYGNDKVKAEARRLGVYDYITKPFQMNRFIQIVEMALQLDDTIAAMGSQL